MVGTREENTMAHARDYPRSARVSGEPGRRRFLRSLGLFGATFALGPALAASRPPIMRAIPASGETLPVIGMGSWITLDVGDDGARRASRLRVVRAFLDHGGRMIDSSPMYGSAEEVIGWSLERIGGQAPFAATKVWTTGREAGLRQMETSRRLWGVSRFDLIHVHNLLDWEVQLATLKAMKAEGRVRYVGVTTSHGRRHDALERILRREPLDFVQFTYNMADREAEARLLPLAAERGVAVVVNRPFRGGALFNAVWNKPLPPWAGEFDCDNWAQFFLKFIVSHPAVTCAIPATSRPDHMHENMGALSGRLPDEALRKRMLDHLRDL
jgi:diketogulonate reductase-like aldo/keto reductase